MRAIPHCTVECQVERAFYMNTVNMLTYGPKTSFENWSIFVGKAVDFYVVACYSDDVRGKASERLR